MSDDKIISFGANRFRKSEEVDKTRIEDAIEAAKEFLQESGGDHIIICCGRTTDDGISGTKFFQAGSFSYHGQMGLLYEVQNMIRDSQD